LAVKLFTCLFDMLRRLLPLMVAASLLGSSMAIADELLLRHDRENFGSRTRELLSDPSSLHHSNDHALISDHFQGSSGKLLIHIQDAHTNFSAQKNLAAFLESLIQHYGVDLVFVEGGTGNDSLSFLREYASPQTRKREAMRFLKKGEIAGEEYLDIVSEEPFLLWGVEDPKLYDKALKLYGDIVKIRGEVLGYLDQIESGLIALKPKIYSHDYLNFKEVSDGFNSSNKSVLDYHAVLSQFADETGVDLSRYFYSAMSMEDILLDFEKAENQITQILAGDENSKRLRKVERDVQITKDFFLLKLTPAELKKIREDERDFDDLRWIAYLNSQLTRFGESDKSIDYQPVMRDQWHRVVDFYETVGQRDDAFISRSLQKMNETQRQIAVIICGGHHTPHLKELMQEQKISFVVAAPLVTQETDFVNYERVLLGDRDDLPSVFKLAQDLIRVRAAGERRRAELQKTFWIKGFDESPARVLGLLKPTQRKPGPNPDTVLVTFGKDKHQDLGLAVEIKPQGATWRPLSLDEQQNLFPI
jgi:hypothetical protein